MTDPAISYEDFLNVDEDVAVCGELTGAEIVAEVLNAEKQDGDQASGDEDGESSVAAEIHVPSAAEAMNHITELRRFFESKHDVSHSIFSSLDMLESFAITDRLNSIKQVKISDFFRQT